MGQTGWNVQTMNLNWPVCNKEYININIIVHSTLYETKKKKNRFKHFESSFSEVLILFFRGTEWRLSSLTNFRLLDCQNNMPKIKILLTAVKCRDIEKNKILQFIQTYSMMTVWRLNIFMDLGEKVLRLQPQQHWNLFVL